VSLHFVWFDLWIGFYWNREKRILYFCPLPMIVFKIQLKEAMG